MARTGHSGQRAVAFVAFGYFLITLYLSLELNAWRDEMYSMHTSDGSMALAVRRAIAFELQPPLYFALLSVWRNVSSSVFFARLLSGLAGVGTVLTVAALSRRIFPRAAPVWAALVVATHPFLIWAGSEIRVYALAILLSALLTLAFYEAHWTASPRRWWRPAYAGLAVLSMYTQYYLGVLFVCFAVALAVRRDGRRSTVFATDMAWVGLLSVPLFLAAHAQIDAHTQDLGPEGTFGPQLLRVLFTRVENFLFSFNVAIDQSRWSLATIRVVRRAYRALVLLVIVVPLWLSRRRLDKERLEKGWPLLVIVLTYAACMLVLFRVTGPWAVGERHIAGLFVPAQLALLAVPALALGPAALRAWALFLAAANVLATLLTWVIPLAKDCDCRRVADTLTTLETSGEPILVFPSEDAMPLALYYRGRNRLLAVPRPPSVDNWDQRSFVIEDVHEISEVLQRSAKDHASLWVHTSDYGDRWGRDKLEAFLAEGYREDEERRFARGVTLRHFVRNGTASR